MDVVEDGHCGHSLLPVVFYRIQVPLPGKGVKQAQLHIPAVLAWFLSDTEKSHHTFR